MLLCVLGAACGSGSGGSSPADTPVLTSRLGGTVNGAGSGVTVSLACAAPAVTRTATTDAQGRYAFDGLPTATCTVAPERRGYRFEPTGIAVELDPASPSTADFVARPVLQVRGADLSGGWVHVDVLHGGEAAEDAQVRINGQVIPFEPASSRYSGELAVEVPVGGTISLEVTFAGATVTGAAAVPEAPVLVARTAGEYFSSGEDLVVSWTSVTSPESFTVLAKWSCGPSCGTAADFEAPGSARSLTIPAGALPAGPIELVVFAYNDGELAGDYEPAETYAGMNVRSESRSAAVIVGQATSRRVAGTVSGGMGGVAVGLACPGAALRTVAVEADGGYAFEAVPATGCTVTPAGDGYRFEPPGVALAAGSADQTGVDFAAHPLLQVRGTAIGPYAANVDVRHAGEPVQDAVVHLNGEALAFLPATGRYHLDWPAPLSAGEVVSLEVLAAGGAVTGTGVFPEAPRLTAPSSGAQLPAGQDILVTWTSATSPDGFLVSVRWSCGTSCGATRGFQAPGSSRSLALPADLLPSGELSVFVAAINDGLLTGDYDPSTFDVALGPGMNLQATSAEALVSR